MGKGFVALILWVFILLFFGVTYWAVPQMYHGIEGQIRDTFFLYRGARHPRHNIVIADIDEKSLAALGQWPWSRNRIAQLLVKIKKLGARTVALDTVFPEPDRTSPPIISGKILPGNTAAKHYDFQLAEAIKNTKPVVGFALGLNTGLTAAATCNPEATMIEQGPHAHDNIYRARSMIPNVPIIQSALTYSGFINMIPDASGMLRSAPLVMRLGRTLYPSFDLEVLRSLQKTSSITVAYEAGKVQTITIGTVHIPVGDDATITINYRGGTRTYPYISVVDILRGHVAPDLFKDAIVLVGTSAAGLVDLRPTPFSRAMPGIEIHANIIDNLLSVDFLQQPYWTAGFNAVLFFLIFSIAFILFLFLDAWWVFWLFLASLFLAVHGSMYGLFHAHFLFNVLLPFLALAVALVFSIWINYFHESRQKKRIKRAFAKKVSPSVIEELLVRADSDILQSQKKTVTVFFSDIRNFTLMTEALQSPQKLIELLNAYIAPMTRIIVSRQGTVDKYIGDAIMAYWNAPKELPNHADAAVGAALEHIAALTTLNQTLQEQFGVAISIGIGIHTGEAIVGEVGSAERSDYTVIGHSVNLASRLEGLNKRYGTRIIISEHTKNALTERYVLRKLAKVHFRESDPMVAIYEVLGHGTPDTALQRALDEYHQGLSYFYAAQWEKAHAVFEALDRNPEQSCTLYRYYRDRTQGLLGQNKDTGDIFAEIL